MAEREVLPQVKNTPVIVRRQRCRSASGHAALSRRIYDNSASREYTIFRRLPGSTATFRATLENTGLGFEHEIRMLQIARDLDMLTIGYAFNDDDTNRLMREASPDIYIFHAGITAGGSTGNAQALSLEETPRSSEQNFKIREGDQTRRDSPGHGAAIVDPEHGEYMLRHTCCQGVQLGSSIERMAVERPLETADGRI